MASAEEAPVVAGLLGEFRDYLGYAEPTDHDMLASVGRLLADDATDFLLGAADSGPPSGVCQLRYRLAVWTGAEDCWLEDIFVRERGAGLGAELIAAAIARARERGCRRIALDTNETNPALRLYERLGFTSRDDPSGARSLHLRQRI
jgi:GNAT superfamily N-acetyltransferase